MVPVTEGNDQFTGGRGSGISCGWTTIFFPILDPTLTTLYMMYITTDSVADKARKRFVLKRLLSWGVRVAKPDSEFDVAECVCGERSSKDENTIINKTNTFVTLFDRVSCPARGVKGEGPDGSGLKLPNMRSMASCLIPAIIIK